MPRMDEARIQEMEFAVSEFIEDYRELAYDPESTASVLGRIISMSTGLAQQLSSAAADASADTVAASDSLTAALKDPSVPPQELQNRERAFAESRADYDRINAAFDQMLEFIESVQTIYLSLLGEDEPPLMENDVEGFIAAAAEGRYEEEESHLFQSDGTNWHRVSEAPEHVPWWKRLIP